MSVGTHDTLAEEGNVGAEGGGVVPKLGQCSWDGSRVGLVEKYLGQQRPDTRCGTLEMLGGQYPECHLPALYPFLGYPAENYRPGNPSFDWPTMACRHR